MQDPNQDTEWNDVLHAKGILPPKVDANGDLEISEDAITAMVDAMVDARYGDRETKPEDMTVDELDALLDDDMDDDRILEEIRCVFVWHFVFTRDVNGSRK
jgi:hypothetical protein